MSDQAPASPTMPSVTIRPGAVLRWLVVVIIVLVVSGTIANLVIYHVAATPDDRLATLMRRFDLGHEPSIPQWYSSAALLAAAGVLAVIASTCLGDDRRYTLHWKALAILFVLLSIDEAVQVHEMVDTVLREQLGTTGWLHFAWVIPGALFVVAVPLTLLRFLASLDSRTRWLFVGSGAMFVTGAIGLELVEGVLIEGAGPQSIAFTMALAVEEGLEMLGVALFLYASLDYLERRGSSAGLTIHAPEPPPSLTDRHTVPATALWEPQEEKP